MKIVSSKEGYNLVASQYREYYDLLDSFDWSESQKLVQACLVNLPSSAAIADLGCGDGRVIGRIHKTCQKLGIGAQCFGFDIAPAMVKRAQKRLGTEISFHELDFNKEIPGIFKHKFDLVVAMFFLVHVPNVADFLRRCTTFLAPGGNLVFNTIRQPNGFSYGEGGQKFYIEWFDHRARAVESAIEDSEFQIVEHIETEDSDIFSIRLS